MHSDTRVQGIFKGSDIEFGNILTDKLKTPLMELPHTKLRASDVLYIDSKNFAKVRE